MLVCAVDELQSTNTMGCVAQSDTKLRCRVHDDEYIGTRGSIRYNTAMQYSTPQRNAIPDAANSTRCNTAMQYSTPHRNTIPDAADRHAPHSLVDPWHDGVVAHGEDERLVQEAITLKSGGRRRILF